ncbi:DUF2865 domain-containing protein [Phyllobacterium sp. 22229]|uniref:DUF2865 domain-containing protein n=1 Tax=Phyllobacterium sp. 22229 TaxID=3453895 RepID=UPI003F83B6E6
MKFIFRNVLGLGLLLSSSLFFHAHAMAEPGICIRLRQQLKLPVREEPQTSRAVQAQAIKLQQARARASQAGCGNTLFSRGDPKQCARFQRNIESLMNGLERQKRAELHSIGSAPSRARILASLKANGCSEERRPGLLEALFGSSTPEPAVRKTATLPRQMIERKRPRQPSQTTDASSRKLYRTLCVRTCDGYYFPISFAVQTIYFDRDQNTCSEMCPGSEVKLYSHAIPEQSSEDMISVETKTPYKDLPAAFNYRIVGVPAAAQCTCHTAQPSLNAAAPASQKASTVIGPELPMAKHGARDERATETGTIARDGGNPFGMILAAPAQENNRRNVRIVGSAYLPDDEGKIDFKASRPSEPLFAQDPDRANRFTFGMAIETVAADILKRLGD